MSLTRILKASLMLAIAVCLFAPTSVSAGHGKHFDQTGLTCCPACDYVCKLEAEQVEVEKSCFKVESKAICIPRVVFPWQKARKAACASCDSCDGRGCTACVHNGARVRKVCVLKTEKYKCPACEYTWSAEKKASCGCCDAAGCDGGCTGVMLPPAVPAAEVSVPQAPAAEAPATEAPATSSLPSAPSYSTAVRPPAVPSGDYYRDADDQHSVIQSLRAEFHLED